MLGYQNLITGRDLKLIRLVLSLVLVDTGSLFTYYLTSSDQNKGSFQLSLVLVRVSF